MWSLERILLPNSPVANHRLSGTMAQVLCSTTLTNATTGPPGSSEQLSAVVVTSVRAMYQLLIVTCIWSAMLVPLFVLLLFFSNRETRRKPIFIANLMSIMLGLILAGVAIPLLVGAANNPSPHCAN